MASRQTGTATSILKTILAAAGKDIRTKADNVSLIKLIPDSLIYANVTNIFNETLTIATKNHQKQITLQSNQNWLKEANHNSSNKSLAWKKKKKH